MILIKHSLVLVTILLAFLLSVATNNSTCPGNLNSACTILPFNLNNTPDVYLNVPDLSVQEISLIVKDIKASVSISVSVANFVSLNAGVDVSIDTVNLTILGVKAQVQLAVYLDNVAKIVARTMESLDLNPLLNSVVDGVSQTVDNSLSSLTRNAALGNQIINDAGEIVEQVVDGAGEVVSSVVTGDYLQNMTATGVTQTLQNGYTIRQYKYSSQTGDILVNIVFDTLNKVVSATVVNPPSTPTAVETTPTMTTVIPTTTMAMVQG